MENQANKNEDIKKLGEMIEDVKVAMLTTVEEDGSLRSRPMMAQEVEFDGDLWFFTDGTAPKVEEMKAHRQVNVSFSDPDDHRYVSISGRASLSYDRSKMEDLWNPIYKAWFPEGLDSPHLALLRVVVDKAEYWDSSSGKMVQLAGFVKSLVTGERFTGGENEKVDL